MLVLSRALAGGGRLVRQPGKLKQARVGRTHVCCMPRHFISFDDTPACKDPRRLREALLLNACSPLNCEGQVTTLSF